MELRFSTWSEYLATQEIKRKHLPVYRGDFMPFIETKKFPQANVGSQL